MAGKYITDLAAATALSGVEMVEISQLSDSVTITAATISAAASDNSFNDSAAGFVTAGFAVGDRVMVEGFSTEANNLFVGTLTDVAAGKLTFAGTDGDVIIDESAGANVTVSKWTTKRAPTQDIADLGGGGGSATYPDFASHAGDVLRVNDTEDDVEWTDPTGIDTVVDGYVSARYWRLRAMQSLVSRSIDGFGLCLLNFRDADDAALIPNGGTAGFASTTDTTNGWSINEAFNGSSASGNGWYSGGASDVQKTPNAPYIGYDLGSAQIPRSVEFAPLTGFLWSICGLIAVEYSADNEVWQTLCVLKVRAGATGVVESYDLPPIRVGVGSGGGGASALADLTDVDVTTTPPNDGDVLSWNNTAGKWEPAAPTGGGGGVEEAPVDGGYYARKDGAWEGFSPGTDTSVPIGGTTGQVLAKASGADGDTEWVDQSGGGGGGTELALPAALNWRLRFPKGSKGTITGETFGVGISELKFLDSDLTTNLATGGTPFASNNAGGNWAIAEAFDGSTATNDGWYSSNDTASGINSYLGYTFATAVTPSAISIAPLNGYNNSLPVTFILEFLDDESIWRPVAEYYVGPGAADTYQTFTVPTTYFKQPVNAGNLWTGIGVAAIGDSITSQAPGGVNWAAKMKTILGSFAGAPVDGVSGSVMSSVPARITAMDLSSVDTLLIFMGTNDYGNSGGRALGALGDNGASNTFYGDVYNVISTAMTTKPTLRLVFLTPLQRTDQTAANSQGAVLLDYVDAIIETCEKYSIAYFDMNRKIGFSSLNYATYSSDGLHPNAAGHLRLARAVSGFLNGF